MARRADVVESGSGDGRMSGRLRCYFHLVCESEAIRDTEGLEVEDLDEAWTQAHEAVLDLARDNPAAAATWAGWRLDVCDEPGVVLFSMNLDLAGAPYWMPLHASRRSLQNRL
jgi:hypothetical protein